MRDLYGLRITPKGYRMVKFDSLLNPLTIYEMTLNRGWLNCACFAASKETCRHREMVKLFAQHDRADKGWFYEYDAGVWHKPIPLNPRRRKA